MPTLLFLALAIALHVIAYPVIRYVIARPQVTCIGEPYVVMGSPRNTKRQN